MRITEEQMRAAILRLGPKAAEAVASAKHINIPPQYLGQPAPAPIASPAPTVECLTAPARGLDAPNILPLSPGSVLAEFTVEGRAVPWLAPVFQRGGPKTLARVKRWKERVATAAHDAGYGEAAGITPYIWPVTVDLWFCRRCPAGRTPGERWPARPDWDNLAKGFLDALTGNVFKTRAKGQSITAVPPSPKGRILADDNIVTDARVSKRYWHRDLVFVRVVAVPAHDPGPYPFPS